jgi:L-lysine exporter family protein LysE/ArgO
MIWTLWKGILLGLGAAAPIGPVNVEIARRSLRGGYWCGVLLGAGAVTIDGLYVVLAAMSVRLYLDYPMVETTVALLGAGLLIYLGVNCLRSVRRVLRAGDLTAAEEPPRRNYLTGVVMTATNPMTLAFWFVVIPAIGSISSEDRRHTIGLTLGVMIGALSWVMFFVGLMSLAGRNSKRFTMVAADLAGGIMLLGFAVLPIWRIVGRHL